MMPLMSCGQAVLWTARARLAGCRGRQPVLGEVLRTVTRREEREHPLNERPDPGALADDQPGFLKGVDVPSNRLGRLVGVESGQFGRE